MNAKLSPGALFEGHATRFRVWAPRSERVEVVAWGSEAPEHSFVLKRSADGTFSGSSTDFQPGDRYGYRLDGEGPYPDPASRFQPECVRGPSEIVDPSAFAWSDESWSGIARDDLILYELHVGTFSPEGTFAGVGDRLPELARLGVTAIELMPVGDFPGRWNWGYDGVSLFAPARCYGRPDDLRRLVDRAHSLGMAVLLDVVYNHFGPDGCSLMRFSPSYLSEDHRTPWGPSVNLDGTDSEMVRAFFIENALHWIREYHVDGLRLDATHAMIDESPRHFLAELSATIREQPTTRPIHLIAEDHRNLARMLHPEPDGGWGLDGLWSDDFHHQLRRLLTGDDDGVYRDFAGTTADLATTIERGWFYTGQFSIHRGKPRGSDPSGLSLRSLVFCIQNHDRIGNRAMGDRLNHRVDPATYRAASALLLLAAETPLLFMGQEWAATSPFLYFTDHEPELGRRVREGRLRDFQSYRAFQEPGAADRIPDPQAESTFLASRLDWSEIDHKPHRQTWKLYRDGIALRRSEPVFRAFDRSTFRAVAPDEDSIVMRYADGRDLVIVACRLRGSGPVIVPDSLIGEARDVGPEVLWTTEEDGYTSDPCPAEVERRADCRTVRFARPGALVLAFRSSGFGGPQITNSR